MHGKGLQLVASVMIATSACASSAMDTRSAPELTPARTGWSAPQPLLTGSGRDSTLVRFPTLAIQGDRAIAAGVNVQAFDGTPLPSRSGVLVHLGVGLLPPPPGASRFILPRIASKPGSGRMDVVWGEAAEGDSVSDSPFGWPPIVRTLWTATLQSDSAWSTPRLLTQNASEWPSAGVIHSHGKIVGFVVPGASSGTVTASLLRVRDTGVESEPIRLPVAAGLLSYPTGLAAGDTLLLAFVSALAERGPDRNSVFVVRSTDGGSTWGPVARVSVQGAPRAHQPAIARVGDGRIAVAWLEEAEDERSHIRLATSTDGGTRWVTYPQSASPAYHDGLQMIGTRNGELLLLFETWETSYETATLATLTWNGEWSAPTVLFPDFIGADARMVLDGEDAPHVVFLGRPRAQRGKDYRGYWTRAASAAGARPAP